MNNKEFISELSHRIGRSTKETAEMIAFLTSDMTGVWEEGNVVAVQGFGNFEVRKKAERISVNPTTKQRMLVPPKLALTFRPASTMKGKFK